MTEAVNIRKSEYDIYIGRKNNMLGLLESKWHNPFKKFKESERKIVLGKYREYILSTDLYNHLEELDGKKIGCFCKPKRCHADVLIELLEEKKRNTEYILNLLREEGSIESAEYVEYNHFDKIYIFSINRKRNDDVNEYIDLNNFIKQLSAFLKKHQFFIFSKQSNYLIYVAYDSPIFKQNERNLKLRDLLS